MNDFTMTQNRKRTRNLHDDDTSEFMPLSKRINNLHINNAFQVIPSTPESVNMFLKPSQWGPGPPYSEETYNIQTHNVIEAPVWDSTPHYNPVLNETQNPYYYNNNKLLFELFVERMQRNGHSFN